MDKVYTVIEYLCDPVEPYEITGNTICLVVHYLDSRQRLHFSHQAILFVCLPLFSNS